MLVNREHNYLDGLWFFDKIPREEGGRERGGVKTEITEHEQGTRGVQKYQNFS